MRRKFIINDGCNHMFPPGGSLAAWFVLRLQPIDMSYSSIAEHVDVA